MVFKNSNFFCLILAFLFTDRCPRVSSLSIKWKFYHNLFFENKRGILPKYVHIDIDMPVHSCCIRTLPKHPTGKKDRAHEKKPVLNIITI